MFGRFKFLSSWILSLILQTVQHVFVYKAQTNDPIHGWSWDEDFLKGLKENNETPHWILEA